MTFKSLLLALFCLLMIGSATAQKYAVSGRITDADKNESLPGATVQILGTGAISDFDGNYSVDLPNGSYDLIVSYSGYETKTEKITIAGAPITLDVSISPNVKVLDAVMITADIARDRKTPVVFSNIPTLKIQEELAGQDIPMILNSTPGVYATQAGGGLGDARISIRGFSQRNVAVMLDGVPVNDMENGQVYWSNWFGLENLTKSMQVQRGLGASKLAVPSVGGSINILTKGIDDKKSLVFSQEIGSGGYNRSLISYNSGRMAHGWGVSGALAYQRQDGVVNQTYSKGLFYYLRVDKQLGKHMLSLSGFGAPQEHGQTRRMAIGTVDSAYSRQLTGVTPAGGANQNFGNTYNFSAGRDVNSEPFNSNINYYHKPQFTLRHSWAIKDNLSLTNVAYVSVGTGGGTSQSTAFTRTLDDGLFNVAAARNANTTRTASRWIRAARNDHFWYGLLSTVKWEINKSFTFSGGLDARDYQGHHFRTVYDYLGAERLQVVNKPLVQNFNKAPYIYQGDTYDYDNTGYVRSGGTFAMIEYSKKKLTAFLNITGAMTGYKLVDHYKPMVVNLADTTFYVGGYKSAQQSAIGAKPFGQTVVYKGQSYTMDSPEAKKQTVDWLYRPSYTFKAGASYNINKHHTIFANAGWLSRAMRYSNIIRENRTNPFIPIGTADNLNNEEVRAGEAGYSYRSKTFSLNVNGYYTSWLNKPLDNLPTTVINGEVIPINVFGISALHQGVEMDFAYNITKKLTVEGLASIGDWKWTSGATYQKEDANGNVTIETFDPTGVHVGDAAQTQFGAAVRFEPIKGLYFKARGTFFGNNYANFLPEDLSGVNAGRESWKMPNYYLVDCNAGYSFKIDKVCMATFRFNVLNALDALYISDAQNNDAQQDLGISTRNFDAQSASVYFGLPRRFNTSFVLTF